MGGGAVGFANVEFVSLAVEDVSAGSWRDARVSGVPESAVDVVDPEFVPLFPLPLAWHETREIKPMVVRMRPKTPKTLKNRFRQLEAIFSLRV